MTTETRTDFETVEKNKQVVVCDVCGFDAEDYVRLAAGLRAERKESEELMQVAETPEEATQLRESHRRNRRFEMKHEMHLARVRKSRLRDIQADTTVDVCDRCFEETFDTGLPDERDRIDVSENDVQAVTEDRYIFEHRQTVLFFAFLYLATAIAVVLFL